MTRSTTTPRIDPLTLPPIVEGDPVAMARALLSYRVAEIAYVIFLA